MSETMAKVIEDYNDASDTYYQAKERMEHAYKRLCQSLVKTGPVDHDGVTYMHRPEAGFSMFASKDETTPKADGVPAPNLAG